MTPKSLGFSLKLAGARCGLLLSTVALCISGLSSARAQAADLLNQPVRLELPANTPLEEALIQWGSQAGIQVMINTPTVAKVTTKGISGTQPAANALRTILADSGLSYTFQDNTVRIVRLSTNDDSKASTDPAESSNRKKAGAGPASEPTEARRPDLEEVVVSAQKREERLQDVPVPVTAVTAESMLENAESRLVDYYASVPGLNLSTDGRGSAQLAIRGLTTGVGSGNPTVAVTVDDVPYGSSSTYGGSIQPIPDLDPSELQRIEVLRGPQGALYGASSIGGLIKYVTVDPSTRDLTGRVQADINSVKNGNGPGFAVRGAANIPINDTLAVRASAFTRRDAGYIDNILTHQTGVNEVTVYGGHLAGLWHMSSDFTLKVSALLQNTRGDGAPDFDPALGDLQQNNIPGTGAYHIRSQSYSATLTGRVGPVSLTSVTGYNLFQLNENGDYTPAIGIASQLGFGVDGAVLTQDIRTGKFSQELRGSIALTDQIDWLLGGFYTSEHSRVYQNWYAAEPLTGTILGNTLLGYWPTTYKEYALFTNLSVRLTDRFEFQVGGRGSKNEQSYSEIDGGNYSSILLGVPGPVISPEVETDDRSFTYLATLQYHIQPDVMAYTRFASGFRPGGPNQDCAAFGLPCQFSPDKTRNYELGLKGSALDRVLTFDTSVYYIDWKSIQLSFLAPGGNFYTNGSRAKSEGVELSLGVNPLRGLNIQLSGAWNEAVLTEPLPPQSAVVAAPGNRLPNSARWSGNLSIQQEFPLWNELSGFVGGTGSYVGERLGSFMGPPGDRQVFPSYVQADLRAGIRTDRYTVTLFANNVTDRRGLLSGGIGSLTPGFIATQPRTIGLSVVASFSK